MCDQQKWDAAIQIFYEEMAGDNSLDADLLSKLLQAFYRGKTRLDPDYVIEHISQSWMPLDNETMADVFEICLFKQDQLAAIRTLSLWKVLAGDNFPVSRILNAVAQSHGVGSPFFNEVMQDIISQEVFAKVPNSLFFPKVSKSRFSDDGPLELPLEIGFDTLQQLLHSSLRRRDLKQVMDIFGRLERKVIDRRVKGENFALDTAPDWTYPLVLNALFEEPAKEPAGGSWSRRREASEPKGQVISLDDVMRRLRGMGVPFGREQFKTLLRDLGDQSISKFPHVLPRVLAMAAERKVLEDDYVQDRLVKWFLTWEFWKRPELLLEFARSHCPGSLAIQSKLFNGAMRQLEDKFDQKDPLGEASSRALRTASLLLLQFTRQEIDILRKREVLQTILNEAPFHTLAMVEMYKKFGLELLAKRPSEAISHARRTGDTATACRMLQVALEPRSVGGCRTTYQPATRDFSGIVDLLLAQGGYAVPVAADGSPRMHDVYSDQDSILPRIPPPGIDLPMIMSKQLEFEYEHADRVAMVCALQGDLEGATLCLSRDHENRTIYPLLLAVARAPASEEVDVLEELGDSLQNLGHPRALDRSGVDQLTSLLALHQNTRVMSQMLEYMEKYGIPPVPQTLRDIKACAPGDSGDPAYNVEELETRYERQLLGTPDQPVHYLTRLGCLKDAYEFLEKHPETVDDRSKFALALGITMDLCGHKVEPFNPAADIRHSDKIRMTVPISYLKKHQEHFTSLLSGMESEFRAQAILDPDGAVVISGGSRTERERALRHIEDYFRVRSLMSPYRMSHARLPFAVNTVREFGVHADGQLSFVYGADGIHAWGSLYRQHGMLAKAKENAEKFATSKRSIRVTMSESYRRRLLDSQLMPPAGTLPLINAKMLEETTGTCAQLPSSAGGELFVFARRAQHTPVAAHVNHVHALLGVCPPAPHEVVRIERLPRKRSFAVHAPPPRWGTWTDVTKVRDQLKESSRSKFELLRLVDTVVEACQPATPVAKTSAALKNLVGEWDRLQREHPDDTTTDTAQALEFMLTVLPEAPNGAGHVPALRLATSAGRIMLETDVRRFVERALTARISEPGTDGPSMFWFLELGSLLDTLRDLSPEDGDREILPASVVQDFVERACQRANPFAAVQMLDLLHQRGETLEPRAYRQILRAQRAVVDRLMTGGAELSAQPEGTPFTSIILEVVKAIDVGALGMFLLDRMWAVSTPRILEAFAETGHFKGLMFVLAKLSHMEPGSETLREVDFARVFERFGNICESQGHLSYACDGLAHILNHLFEQESPDKPFISQEALVQAASTFAKAGDTERIKLLMHHTRYRRDLDELKPLLKTLSAT